MSGRRKPRGILFDVGMTLVHPDGKLIAAELAAEGIAGISADDAIAALQMSCDAAHMRLPAGRDVAARTGLCFAAALDLAPRPTVAALTRALADRDLYRVPDAHALPLLRALRSRGLTLGVVANSEGHLDELLERFSLRAYFDQVIDSTDVGFSKPSAEIFRIALDRLGLTAGECWYVGDHVVNDVVGGLAVGFDAIVLYDRLDLFPHIPGVLRVRELSAIEGLVDAST